LSYRRAVEVEEVGEDLGGVGLVGEEMEGGEVGVGEEVGPALLGGSSWEGGGVAFDVHVKGDAGEGDAGGEAVEEMGGGEAFAASKPMQVGPFNPDQLNFVLFEEGVGALCVQHGSHRLHGLHGL